MTMAKFLIFFLCALRPLSLTSACSLPSRICSPLFGGADSVRFKGLDYPTHGIVGSSGKKVGSFLDKLLKRSDLLSPRQSKAKKLLGSCTFSIYSSSNEYTKTHSMQIQLIMLLQGFPGIGSSETIVILRKTY